LEPGRRKSFLDSVQRGPVVHPNSYAVGTGGSFLGEGRRSSWGVRLVIHSPLSLAEVKKQWSCTSNLRFCAISILKENPACSY